MFKKIAGVLRRKNNRKILGIGHSHILAIQFCLNSQKEDLEKNLKLELQTIWLGDDRYKDYRKHVGNGGTEGFIWAKEIADEIKNLNAETDILFSAFGGNAHNILGMVQHPRAFDFVLSSKPSLFINEKVELVPEALVELAMTSQGGFPETVWCLRAARGLYSGRIVHIESPPPIKDNDYLKNHAGAFKDQFEIYGISPPLLRYKLWLLHSMLIKQECRLQNIEFIECPKDFIDEEGFLKSNGLAMDTTHANAAYGDSVIKQLIKVN
jgi:hypothetical protein